jgi:hypothetical protein
MGLVLSLKRGQDFYVRDTRVVVNAVDDDGFTLRRTDGGGLVKVTRDFAVELFPDVRVSASQKIEIGVAKIVIEAPREIGIILGSRYRHPSMKAIDEYVFGHGPKPLGVAS